MPPYLKNVFPFVIALVAVGIAVLLQVGKVPLIGDHGTYGIFTLAIIIAAWVGGLWPGLLATVLSIVLDLLFFADPSLANSIVGWMLLGIFTVNGVLISLVCEFLHRSRRKAEIARSAQQSGQDRLAEAEGRQRIILNAIPHLVWTADAEGNINYVNQSWEEKLDLQIENTRDRGWVSHVYEADVPSVIEAWENAQQTQTPFIREFRIKMRDGSYRWHLVHIDPSKDANGKIAGWFGTATDVDEARRAIEATRSSEERFRQLADSSPVMIWISDTTKACTWFNRPRVDYSGRSMEQEIGFGWTEAIHPDDYERSLKIYTESFDARVSFEMDYRLRRHDGVYRWLMDRGIPLIGADGTFLGYVGSCIDINERKEAEESKETMLRIETTARAEAERTALLKDEFLATVSHEMRTPLTAMLGWVQLLRNGSLPPETVPQALETIERNARAQAKLIDDLLDMSRILSGRLRLDVQSVNVFDIVEAAIAAAEPGAAAKRIQLIRVLDPRTGPVSGDPTRLQQVIWNLLNNAIKFTPNGGKITVTLERVNSHLEVSVIDTGEGITPEFLPNVFDRFRQQDASTARRHDGLGLGLSIVKQLVELHGGSVRAKSPGPGRGSTFIVTLPIMAVHGERLERNSPAVPERPRSEEAVPTLLGTRVLVVDDDADARDLLRSILAQSGASVRTASSVPEALKQLESRQPHVLVSDIGMPGEDGYSLIRQVRNLTHEKGGNVPALALTAFARSDDRRRAIGAGFHMHLAKPVEPAELVTVVASLAKR
jgi:PAS domain S-box-containing protein